MDRHPKHMKISELSALANTSLATIRYYLREGLLHHPVKTSKTMAYYTDEHLQRLLEIQNLKKSGFPLIDIKGINKRKRGKGIIQEPILTNTLHTSKREEIIKAAVELLRDKGYDSIRISDIVKRSSIGKGTFYQYFKNKEELFFECVDRIFYDIGMDIPQIREEKDAMKRLWHRGTYFARFHRHMIDMLNLARGASIKENPHFKQKLDEAMKNLIEPIKNDLDMAVAQEKINLKDSNLVAHLLMGAVEYAIYYYRDNRIGIEDLVKKSWDLILNGAVSEEKV